MIATDGLYPVFGVHSFPLPLDCVPPRVLSYQLREVNQEDALQ